MLHQIHAWSGAERPSSMKPASRSPPSRSAICRSSGSVAPQNEEMGVSSIYRKMPLRSDLCTVSIRKKHPRANQRPHSQTSTCISSLSLLLNASLLLCEAGLGWLAEKLAGLRSQRTSKGGLGVDLVQFMFSLVFSCGFPSCSS